MGIFVPMNLARSQISTIERALMESQGTPPIEVLSCWKDIAAYMGKGVRTVQRYERELKLPVRRPAGKTRGTVLAFKAEIDAWIKARPVRESFRRSIHGIENGAILGALSQETMQTRLVREEMRRLREETIQLRRELTTAREELRSSRELLHKSLRPGFMEEDHLQLLSSGRRRIADVLIFDPNRKAN
jgi:hypothetical protein